MTVTPQSCNFSANHGKSWQQRACTFVISYEVIYKSQDLSWAQKKIAVLDKLWATRFDVCDD